MDILEGILEALQKEERVMLATILSTSGSTPASAFSQMLVKDRCKVSVGTVGGGCVEGDVLGEARRLFDNRAAAILTFHLTEDHLESGMLCGGSLDVLIEPLTNESIPLVKSVRALRDAGEDCIVATFLQNDGQIRWKVLLRSDESKEGMPVYHADRVKHLVSSHWAEVSDSLAKVSSRLETLRVHLPEGELILQPVLGRPSLVLFGGGHVSKSVSRAAAMAGFRVTVVDDRKEFSNPERFPEAAETLCIEFGEAFRHVTVTPSTYVIIVTRGHRSDEELLEQVARTPARYVGMIGSTRKVLRTYENLLERGIPLEALSKVHAPVGIDIGAVTAEEIGISIVAQLIHVRRGSSRQLPSKSDAMKPMLSEMEKRSSAGR
jgi:xanthine dehydrogenase accessory factor